MTTGQQRRANTTLAFHASRIVIDVGVLLVMGSMSLPFVSTAAGDRSAIAADALPALLLVLPIFAITLVPDHSRPIPRPMAWASLVLGLAAFPYSVVKFFDAGVLADTLGGSVGIGARLLVFGTFVVLAGIAIGLTRLAMNLPSGGTPGARTTGRGSTPGGGRSPDAPARRAAAASMGRGSPPSQPRPEPGRSATADSDHRDETRMIPRARPGSPAPEQEPSEGS